MHPVLAGKTVVELGTLIAAPFAGHLLAQLGASVIKVEPPAGDQTRSMMRGGPSGTFIAYSRGKKSICIDLKKDEGRAVFARVLGKADVVIHNLAPASLSSLGVTYEDCMRANPDLVYCHIQGYAAGPRHDEIASNPVVEAATGVMYMHRIDGRPTRLGPSHHDQFAGSYAVIGILAALAADRNDKKAHRVEVGLFETGLHIAARDIVGAQLKTQLGVKASTESSAGEFSMPGYGAYETSDRRWIFLLMLTDGHWQKFGAAMNLDEVRDEQYATSRQRKKLRPQVEAIVNAAVAAVTFDEIAARLRNAGVGFTEVKDTAQVLDDAQAQQPGKLQLVPFGGLQFDVPNFPLPNQLGDGAGELPPPLLGQHSLEIMRSLGISDAECAAIVACGAVRAGGEGSASWAPPRNRS